MSDILENLIGAEVTDIFVIGYSETYAAGRKFCPLMDILFMEVNGRLFSFSSAAARSCIEFAEADSLCSPYELEEDDVFAWCSIWDVVAIDSVGTHFITEIEVYGLQAIGDGKIRCSAIGILANSQYFFLDPMHVSGIKIGGRELFDRWNTFTDLERPSKLLIQ